MRCGCTLTKTHIEKTFVPLALLQPHSQLPAPSRSQVKALQQAAGAFVSFFLLFLSRIHVSAGGCSAAPLPPALLSRLQCSLSLFFRLPHSAHLPDATHMSACVYWIQPSNRWSWSFAAYKGGRSNPTEPASAHGTPGGSARVGLLGLCNAARARCSATASS
jgi:hypothetical protein